MENGQFTLKASVLVQASISQAC